MSPRELPTCGATKLMATPALKANAVEAVAAFRNDILLCTGMFFRSPEIMARGNQWLIGDLNKALFLGGGGIGGAPL